MTTPEVTGWRCGLCAALADAEYHPPPTPDTKCSRCSSIADPCGRMLAEVVQLRDEVRELRRPNAIGSLTSSVTAPTAPPGDDTIDAKEAAELLRLPSVRALYAAVRRLQVPATRLGDRRLRFSRSKLTELVR